MYRFLVLVVSAALLAGCGSDAVDGAAGGSVTGPVTPDEVIVETPDAIVVVHKDRTEDLKSVVAELPPEIR